MKETTVMDLNLQTVPKTAATLLGEIESGTSAGGGPAIFATGFELLDRALGGGLRGGDLVLVSGGPGVGKTVATLQWAAHIAASGTPAAFACYEHDHATLLARLLLSEIGGYSAEVGRSPSAQVRDLVRSIAAGERRISDLVPGSDQVLIGVERVRSYADRLLLLGASAARTGLAELDDIAGRFPERSVLFVDYLQKVAVPETGEERRRVTQITEGLKEIALHYAIPVVAVVAGNGEGLNARRLRIHHLRGSSSLAYEADVVIMLSDKFRAVSNVHTAYDPVRAETFRHQVVFTIEKNRDGPAPLDLEFHKDFEHYRFSPDGAYVAERLVDDHTTPE